MKNKIPTGSYVIRNKKTSTVLHVEDPNPKSPDSAKKRGIVASAQDENRYREQQVWWIEPFPDCNEDDQDGLVYSIMNTSNGKFLDLNPGRGGDGIRKDLTKGGRRLVTRQDHAAPWQKWRIQKVQDEKDEKDETYFKISSVWNGEVVDISDIHKPEENGHRCYCMEYVSGNEQQAWEFVIPIVAFPPGWFQIQNSQTRGLLSHSYLSSPPVLINPPELPSPSEYRESWNTQWTLAYVGSVFPEFECTTGANTWLITNRLTGGFLGNMYNNSYPFRTGRKVGADNWGFDQEDIKEHIWKLEIDPACTSRWKIIHHGTGFLLERTNERLRASIEVACVGRKFTRGDKDKTWLLTSPVVENTEDAPPEYESGRPIGG